MHDDFDGFSIKLLLEDEEWVAYFSELPSVSAFGNTREEAKAELKIAWTAYKESCKKHNEPIPHPTREKRI